MTIDLEPSWRHQDAGGSDLSVAVALFRSLADPTRLAVVQLLAGGEQRVTDLVGELGLAQSTVSAQTASTRPPSAPN
jgi:predicted transcriptional regulator